MNNKISAYFAMFAAVLCGISLVCNAEMVGFWSFDPGQSGIADLSGHGNEASLVGGASNSSDCVYGGGALLLNGSDAYAELFSGNGLEGDFSAGEASLSMWVKLSNSTLYDQGLGSFGSWPYTSFYPASGGENMTLKFFLSEGEDIVAALGAGLDITNWNHLAVTVDALDETSGYKVYLNGELAGSYPMNGVYGNFIKPRMPRLGMCYDISTATRYYFTGLIDEVKIFNHALSEVEVKSSYILTDMNSDGRVDYSDMVYIADRWGDSCPLQERCGEADLDRNGSVGVSDLAILGENWLK